MLRNIFIIQEHYSSHFPIHNLLKIIVIKRNFLIKTLLNRLQYTHTMIRLKRELPLQNLAITTNINKLVNIIKKNRKMEYIYIVTH